MDTVQSVIAASVVDIGVRYRGDSGLSISVYGAVEGRHTELLRFDCFDNAPHYHYGPEVNGERFALDDTANGDPVQWTLEILGRGRLKPMIERAGYPAIAAALDEALVAAALPQVISQAHALVDEHTS